MPIRRSVFTGEICGFGTTSGDRFVVGRWVDSPLGAFTDVMHEAGAKVGPGRLQLGEGLGPLRQHGPQRAGPRSGARQTQVHRRQLPATGQGLIEGQSAAKIHLDEAQAGPEGSGRRCVHGQDRRRQQAHAMRHGETGQPGPDGDLARLQDWPDRRQPSRPPGAALADPRAAGGPHGARLAGPRG